MSNKYAPGQYHVIYFDAYGTKHRMSTAHSFLQAQHEAAENKAHDGTIKSYVIYRVLLNSITSELQDENEDPCEPAQHQG